MINKVPLTLVVTYCQAYDICILNFQFGTEFISVLNKKKEFNTFQDTTKKKQQPSKDNFWPVSF
jgi:hypothetical protein